MAARNGSAIARGVPALVYFALAAVFLVAPLAVLAQRSVSADGGLTWADADFIDRVQRFAWRRWKFDWITPEKPGKYTLMARARDANGHAQPDRHDPSYGSYVINHPLPIEVFVENPGQWER